VTSAEVVQIGGVGVLACPRIDEGRSIRLVVWSLSSRFRRCSYGLRRVLATPPLAQVEARASKPGARSAGRPEQQHAGQRQCRMGRSEGLDVGVRRIGNLRIWAAIQRVACARGDGCRHQAGTIRHRRNASRERNAASRSKTIGARPLMPKTSDGSFLLVLAANANKREARWRSNEQDEYSTSRGWAMGL